MKFEIDKIRIKKEKEKKRISNNNNSEVIK